MDQMTTDPVTTDSTEQTTTDPTTMDQTTMEPGPTTTDSDPMTKDVTMVIGDTYGDDVGGDYIYWGLGCSTIHLFLN